MKNRQHYSVNVKLQLSCSNIVFMEGFNLFLIISLIHFNVHEWKCMLISICMCVSPILNEDNVKEKNFQTECLLVLSIFRIVQLSSVEKDRNDRAKKL